MAMATTAATLDLPFVSSFGPISSGGGGGSSNSIRWEPIASAIARRGLRRPLSPLFLRGIRPRGAPCRMSLNVNSEPAEAGSQQSAPDAAASIATEAPIDPRRAEEKFAVLNTGKWECRSCGYVYDQFVGDSSYPVAAGTEFGRLPEDWRCPTCGASKTYFNSKSVEVAGFAENQNYGFGTNTLTSAQKSLLIYGSLLFFFLLFLSGYFLQ